MISAYFVDFMIFSFIGWVYECTYCMVKNRHWDNRGFLYGPVCPIYGSGALGAILLFGHLPLLQAADTPAWKIFLICAAGSVVLEYTTSWVLEKIFHAVWWDYSDIPLNINGRVCLPATCGFGLAGILVVRFLLPFVDSLSQESYPLEYELVSLIMMLFLGADLALTVASLTSLIARLDAMESEFNVRMENSVQLAQQGPAAVGAAAKAAAKAAARKAATEAETAARTAEKELAQKLSAYAENMSERQKYHLRSIHRFRRGQRQDLASRLKMHLQVMEKRAIERRKHGDTD